MTKNNLIFNEFYDEFHNEFFNKVVLKEISIREKLRQTLFDADHRNMMIDRYGMTEAETVTIEELI